MFVDTLVLLLQAGGQCLEDLRGLNREAALMALPDPDPLGDGSGGWAIRPRDRRGSWHWARRGRSPCQAVTRIRGGHLTARRPSKISDPPRRGQGALCLAIADRAAKSCLNVA